LTSCVQHLWIICFSNIDSCLQFSADYWHLLVLLLRYRSMNCMIVSLYQFIQSISWQFMIICMLCVLKLFDLWSKIIFWVIRFLDHFHPSDLWSWSKSTSYWLILIFDRDHFTGDLYQHCETQCRSNPPKIRSLMEKSSHNLSLHTAWNWTFFAISFNLLYRKLNVFHTVCFVYTLMWRPAFLIADCFVVREYFSCF
jgi:hypothetical protein